MVGTPARNWIAFGWKLKFASVTETVTGSGWAVAGAAVASATRGRKRCVFMTISFILRRQPLRQLVTLLPMICTPDELTATPAWQAIRRKTHPWITLSVLRVRRAPLISRRISLQKVIRCTA